MTNGRIPLASLVHVQNNIWLPAGTLARWRWAVMQASAKYGVTLRITGQASSAWNTWNGYRPYSAQVLYRNAYGVMAAVPGYSSHGGTYRNQIVFAIDVDNWAELGWARFVAIMRLAGLTVDFVTPREQWHVGDFNDPYTAPSFAGGGGGSALNPGSTTTIISEEEDDMKHWYVQDDCDGNGRPGWILMNTKTGTFYPPLVNDGSQAAQDAANGWARSWGSARWIVRQDMLNAQAVVQKTG